MMKLSAVGALFNRTALYDPYWSGRVIRGRLLPQDDNTRDSVSAERRTLAVNPGTPIPARRVVADAGQRWIVGSRSRDYHGDDVLHEHYTLHRVEGLAQVLTFEEALTSAAGQSIDMGLIWVKDEKEPTESSRVYPEYQLYYSMSEHLLDPTRVDGEGSESNVLVSLNGRWFMIRSIVISAGGFFMASASELPGPVVSNVEFSTMTYDRLRDEKVPSTKTVDGVALRWQTSFVYPTVYSNKYEPGDRQLAVLKSEVTPQPGDIVKVGPRTMKVVSKVSQGNLWFVHLTSA